LNPRINCDRQLVSVNIEHGKNDSDLIVTNATVLNVAPQAASNFGQALNSLSKASWNTVTPFFGLAKTNRPHKT
jgi:hypothetical protein